MAWCKVSSLTAAVARSLKGMEYPAKRDRILASARGLVVEGWELDYFLERSLNQSSYPSLRAVMNDLEAWLERQG